MPECEPPSLWLQSWKLSCIHDTQSRGWLLPQEHHSWEREAWAVEG